MSFILDALKKSERERERQQPSAAVEITYGRQPRNKPWWLWLVLALLIFNCVLLLVLWFRRDSPVTAPTTVSASSSTAASSVSATVRVMSPSLLANREVRALQDEASHPTDPEDTTSVLLSEAAIPEGVPLVRAASTASELGISNYPSKPESGQTATLSSLGGSAALNLPDIRLDLHVYSIDKTKRFVFINSKKYTEGQALSEGPVVEQITDDGVMLSYLSQQFLLPRR
jgi:general secretion pathway protein B